MKLAILFLGFVLSTSVHADGDFYCINARGDTLNISFSNGGQKMYLRSLEAELNLSKSKKSSANAEYFNFYGRYPGGVGRISVQATLLADDPKPNEIIGTITLEGDQFGCQTGKGKLIVSRATRREFSGGGQRGEPCKLTSYYQGITFMPPRVVCNYGGFVSITGGGRPF